MESTCNSLLRPEWAPQRHTQVSRPGHQRVHARLDGLCAGTVSNSEPGTVPAAEVGFIRLRPRVGDQVGQARLGGAGTRTDSMLGPGLLDRSRNSVDAREQIGLLLKLKLAKCDRSRACPRSVFSCPIFSLPKSDKSLAGAELPPFWQNELEFVNEISEPRQPPAASTTRGGVKARTGGAAPA